MTSNLKRLVRYPYSMGWSRQSWILWSYLAESGMSGFSVEGSRDEGGFPEPYGNHFRVTDGNFLGESHAVSKPIARKYLGLSWEIRSKIFRWPLPDDSSLRLGGGSGRDGRSPVKVPPSYHRVRVVYLSTKSKSESQCLRQITQGKEKFMFFQVCLSSFILRQTVRSRSMQPICATPRPL